MRKRRDRYFYMQVLVLISLLQVSAFAYHNQDVANLSKLKVLVGKASGAIVKFENRSQQRALLITNGHNVYFTPFGGHSVENRSSKRVFKITDLKNNLLMKLNARKMLYSTMYHTDLAIYELQESYEEIESITGLRPLVISRRGPSIAEEVRIFSLKSNSYYHCHIFEIVPKLVEVNWTWLDSIKYDQDCKVYEGSSGAPIVSMETGEVIGIHNTSARAHKPCSLSAPCEYAKDGKFSYHPGSSYGQNLHWLYDCLSENLEDLEFDFNRENCKLVGQNN